MNLITIVLPLGLFLLCGMAYADPQPAEKINLSSFLQQDCERTRLQPAKVWATTNQIWESCFGINNSRNDILATCVKYPIDFNQICLDGYYKNTGQVPLYYAVMNLNDEAVNVLIEHGADAKLAHLIRNLPFQVCHDPKRLPICKSILHTLVSHGADINDPRSFDTENPPNSTPLMLAARGRDEAVVAMLLDAGADINATPSGCTALDEANDFNPTMIDFLKKHGGRRNPACLAKGAALFAICRLTNGCAASH